MTEFALNTFPSPPDQRDIPFVPEVWPPSSFAHSIDLMPNVEEVEDQLTIGSCVANGVIEQCEHIAKRCSVDTDLSRLFLYTATLDYENRLGQEGLMPRDALKVAFKYGLPPEDGPTGYPYDITKAAVRPPDAVYLVAAQSRVLRYEAVVPPGDNWQITQEWQERIDRIKSALNEGLPVGIALQVTASIYSLTGPWRLHQYQLASPLVDYIGGHYMVIIGYDDSCGRFLVQNSWGPAWGDGGFCGLPYNIVSQMFFEAWIIRNFDGYEIPEAPGIKFEGVNRFHLEARIVPEASDIGKTVNVWMGAVLPNGQIYLRDAIPLEQLGNDQPTGLYDNWTPAPAGSFPPTATGVVLQADTRCVVVQWRSLADLAGTDVYLAYGLSPMDWKLQKLCTIPSFSL